MTSRFNTPRVRFGATPAKTDDGTPSTSVTRAALRRTAQLAEADDVLRVIPKPGEAVHTLMTGRYDLMHLIVVLVRRLGIIDAMRIGTLSFNAANLKELLALLDSKAVGTMTLLCSSFFRDHNKDLWQETVSEFRERGQSAAAARSHAKVVTLALADGQRLVLEGSANLRSNGNCEQLTLLHDSTIHDFHAEWVDGLVTRHYGQGDQSDG